MVKLQKTSTQYISIGVPYDQVFDYLTNPLFYKEWSTNFIKDISLEKGEHYALTPMGRVKFVVKGDRQSGNIDLFFGETPFPTHTRVLRNAEGATYLFTLFKNDELPNAAWEAGIAGLIEELETLKNQFDL
ncbi:MAG: hypothetical protein JST58_19505 [Bacteroidetes bacterium]|jgi:hypothetical protein|nr:hypothetical protein [Bacteroidota bacterium]